MASPPGDHSSRSGGDESRNVEQRASKKSRTEKPTTQRFFLQLIKTACTQHEPAATRETIVNGLSKVALDAWKRAKLAEILHKTNDEKTLSTLWSDIVRAYPKKLEAKTVSMVESAIEGLRKSELWSCTLAEPVGLFESFEAFSQLYYDKQSDVKHNVVDLAMGLPRQTTDVLARLVFPTSGARNAWLFRERTYAVESGRDASPMCYPQVPVAVQTICVPPREGDSSLPQRVVVVSGGSGIGKTFSAIVSGASFWWQAAPAAGGPAAAAAAAAVTAAGAHALVAAAAALAPAAVATEARALKQSDCGVPVVPVVILLRRDDLGRWDDARWAPHDARDVDTAARDKNAAAVVCRALAKMQAWLPKPARGETVPGSAVTLILDELGDVPNLVRAIISNVQPIVTAVRDATFAADVRVVVVGTGTSTASLAPGSSVDNYHLWTPDPCPVWDHMLPRSPISGRLKELLANGPKQPYETAASIAAAIGSENARMAALLLRALMDYRRPDLELDEQHYWDRLISQATFSATTDFNRLNGLAKVPMSEYLVTVADALVTAYYAEISHPAIHKRIFVRHGLAWDAARRKKDSDTSTEVIEIPTECAKQRYWASHANVLMAEIYTNLGMRHTSGEGFEEFVCDWLLWSVSMTRQAAKLNKHCSKRQPPQQSTASAARGWITPAVFQLERFVLAATPSTTPRKIICAKFTAPVLRNSTKDDVLNALKDHDQCRTADIIALNADKTSFADVIVMRRSTNELFLVQTKRYLETSMTAENVDAELYKMGLVTEDTTRAGVIAQMRSRHPKPSEAAAADRWATTVTEALIRTFESTCSEATKAAIKAVLTGQRRHWEALLKHLTRTRVRFLEEGTPLTGLKAATASGTVTVHYVIVLIGQEPAKLHYSNPHVHLVYAGSAKPVRSPPFRGLSIHDGLYPLGAPLHRRFSTAVETAHRKPRGNIEEDSDIERAPKAGSTRGPFVTVLESAEVRDAGAAILQLAK